jgi:hypothetical protein
MRQVMLGKFSEIPDMEMETLMRIQQRLNTTTFFA